LLKTTSLRGVLFKPLSNSEREPKHGGWFNVAGKELHGEITLDGANSSLYLHDREHFNTTVIPNDCITGTLHDLTKVSLLDCRVSSGTGHASRGGETYCFAQIFPHFVLYGDRHINPTEKAITEIAFEMDDASILFYDFGAFGRVIDARPFIEQIVRADGVDLDIETGPNPQILYFTGKHKIFSVETVVGRIFGSHTFRSGFGGPDGIRLDNTILVAIAFKEEVRFDEAMRDASALLLYLGLLVGRPQNFLKLRVRIKAEDEVSDFLDVVRTMPIHRNPAHPSEKPHPGDVLLDAINDSKEFSLVTANWFSKQPQCKDARMRFFNSYDEQRHYSVDRLISSANMFDILPREALPTEIELGEKLKAARDAAQNAFRALPYGPERDSVLAALGRVGKASLKQKVRHRLQKVTEALPDVFSDLHVVCDEAVNCRNYYVHGGPPRFDYSNNFDVVVFFTETLEFVFAASDLIESGWDVKKWMDKRPQFSHPFGRYRINYSQQLKHLKFFLPE
jgi:hypothetical protein